MIIMQDSSSAEEDELNEVFEQLYFGANSYINFGFTPKPRCGLNVRDYNYIGVVQSNTNGPTPLLVTHSWTRL